MWFDSFQKWLPLFLNLNHLCSIVMWPYPPLIRKQSLFLASLNLGCLQILLWSDSLWQKWHYASSDPKGTLSISNEQAPARLLDDEWACKGKPSVSSTEPVIPQMYKKLSLGSLAPATQPAADHILKNAPSQDFKKSSCYSSFCE